MIAIFTDFGIHGPYVGQLHAALHRDAPGVAVVDLFNDLPAFNVKAAAYLLPAYSQYLPDDCVCLCVVDPGVGTERRALALKADSRWYVGPDNSLFSVLARRAGAVQVYEVTWRPQYLSESFHGRDLFAPVAAMIARGDAVPGEPVPAQALVATDWPDELAEVVYIDSYGNAVTGLRAQKLTRDATLGVAGRRLRFRRVFGEAAAGEPFWYENANGLVEIAVANGSAAAQLGLHIGAHLRRG
jgi:S-adenosylmethionine hydrolase